MDEVERTARALAAAAGLDPDAVSFEDIRSPRATWRMFEEQARAEIEARQAEQIDAVEETYVSYAAPDFMGLLIQCYLDKYDGATWRDWL